LDGESVRLIYSSKRVWTDIGTPRRVPKDLTPEKSIATQVRMYIFVCSH
jgi:hypothetical protein